MNSRHHDPSDLSRSIINNKNAFFKVIDQQWVRVHKRARDLWNNSRPDIKDLDILSNVGDSGHRGDQPIQAPWGEMLLNPFGLYEMKPDDERATFRTCMENWNKESDKFNSNYLLPLKRKNKEKQRK
jgi:hypothetical protein